MPKLLTGVVAIALGLPTLLVIPLAAAPSASADPPTGGTTIVSETFTGASVPDPAWTTQNDTCLTGATSNPPAGAAQIPTCSAHRTGPVPAMGGVGYLQLTDAANNRRGSVLYNRPVPATAGVSITLDQYQYGGTGADGIGFFLVDGSTNLTDAGGNGGSLGYAQIVNGANSQPGVAGGVLGVGLDSYGNFFNDGESRGSGCPAGQRSPTTVSGPIAPNVITVRGGGSNFTGYCYLASTTPPIPPANPTQPGTTLNGGTGTLRATTLAASFRQVNVQVTPAPNPRVIVQVRYHPATAGDPWVVELNTPAPSNLPSTYKFGLSASTGGSTDVHLIRNALVRSINPLSNLQLQKQVDRTQGNLPAVITAGTVIPYQYTVTNAGLEPLSSLVVSDNKITVPITCDLTTLQPAPAAGSTTTCRGRYTVTATDVSTPPSAVVNTATATARDPGNVPVVSPPATVTVPLTSSVSLTKSVVTAAPYVQGQQVQYAYTVTNTGGSTLTNVSVADNLIPSTKLICQANVLASGASTTCAGTYVVDPSQAGADGRIVNTATASGQTPIGQNVVSAPATANIAVNTDIAVTKVVDDDTPDVGDNVTFTVTTTNKGPALATNVVISDQLPVGRLTYQSSAVSGPQPSSYDQSVGAWSIPALAVGNTLTLTLVARVDTNTAVTNSAVLARLTQIDINDANNSASATVNPVTPVLDLAVTKDLVGNHTVVVGDPATFHLTVTNHGPSAGTGITIRDPLPPGLTYDAAGSGGDGSYDPDTGIWTIGSLGVGASAAFDIAVTTTTTGSFANVATLDTVSPDDTNPKNNTDTASLTVVQPTADLSIVKAVFPQTAVVGDTVTYQVVVNNKGPDTVHGVYVTDAEPGGVTVLSTSATQGAIAAAADRWDIGTLAPGDSVQATVTARVETVGTHVNTVVVDAPLLIDPTPSDNRSTATLTSLGPAVDVGVTKSVAAVGGGSTTTVPLGQQVRFTVTATNHAVSGSPATTATNVTFDDIMEPGLTFVSASGDGTYDSTTGRWTVPSLPVGGQAVLTIVAVGATVGQHTNTVGLSGLDQRDVDPTNNSASASATFVELADLAIAKSVSPTVAQPGDTVTYTVTVTNHGPNATDDTTVVDPSPIAADLTGFTPSTGTFDLATRTWLIPHLGVSSTATLTVTVLLDAQAAGPYQNVVVIQQSRVTDPDLTNNGALANLFVPVADIAVTKTVDDPAPVVGDLVTFHVGLSNLGPDAAQAVTVDDLLPDGLTLTSQTASVGSYDPTSGVWTVGDMDPKNLGDPTDEATLTIVARVERAGTFTNVATSDRTGAFPFDPQPGNNSDSASIAATPAPADLAVTKTVSPASVALGGLVRFTVTTANAGPAAAADTVVTDSLPPATRPTAVSDQRCSISGQVVTCHLGPLGVGARVSVVITATTTTTGRYTNSAVVSTSTPETTLDNNVAAADGTVTVPPPEVLPEKIGFPGSGGLSRTGANITGQLVVAGWVLLVGVLLVVGLRRRRSDG